jgi:microcystin-dependent protein
MALRQRTYFFDAGNADRFNSQDIPTEQTMSDWCDSVPFIKEITDRAQLTRAGIAKTTTDAKINTGVNVDAAGVSPLGFTSFVRPAQIPKILDSPSITWTKVPRGGATNTDTGVGIEDWRATVQFPVDPVETTQTVELHQDYDTRIVDGVGICNLSEIVVNNPATTPLNVQLQTLENAIHNANVKIIELADALCNSQDTQVALGDVILTVTPPSYWGTNWAEPLGQDLLIADHLQLYALFTNTYGAAAPGYFKIPDLVQQENYFRAKQTQGGLLFTLNGGQATRTLGDLDIPDHTHTFSATTLPSGDHNHVVNVYPGPGTGSFIESDGDGGTPNTTNTNNAGTHTHTVTGTTDSWGEISPDPVWNIATSVTPRYTNFFLKMRVK